MTKGTDYGMGKTNIDKETGIRYGVIASNSVGQVWYERQEADYGEPRCPECKGQVTVLDQAEEDTEFEFGCPACEKTFDSEDVYPDEPLKYFYRDEEYILESGFDNTEIFVIKSPYYTYAQFCSPCAPGAGNLDESRLDSNDGVKTYCLGQEWFLDKYAPYAIYKIGSEEEK